MGSNGLKEKLMKECAGKVISSNNCGDFKIIKYISANEVLVKFLKTGTEVWCTKNHAFDGSVKDRYFPTICGIGYYGNALPKRSHPKIERAYNVWSKMLRRCYDEENKQFKDYSDCSVSENFACFEYFLLWYLSQVGSDKNNWQLDKDLPIKYRYHVKTALGNYLFIKAKTYEEAQKVVDSILGTGLYSPSASNI